MTLGERILLARRRLALTQQQLASAAHLNITTLGRVERGETQDLCGQRIVALCLALGCSSDYLLGLSEEETPSVN
jgi:transcriptional regulator with XRE-family HTH domain